MCWRVFVFRFESHKVYWPEFENSVPRILSESTLCSLQSSYGDPPQSVKSISSFIDIEMLRQEWAFLKRGRVRVARPSKLPQRVVRNIDREKH